MSSSEESALLLFSLEKQLFKLICKSSLEKDIAGEYEKPFGLVQRLKLYLSLMLLKRLECWTLGHTLGLVLHLQGRQEAIEIQLLQNIKGFNCHMRHKYLILACSVAFYCHAEVMWSTALKERIISLPINIRRRKKDKMNFMILTPSWTVRKTTWTGRSIV